MRPGQRSITALMLVVCAAVGVAIAGVPHRGGDPAIHLSDSAGASGTDPSASTTVLETTTSSTDPTTTTTPPSTTTTATPPTATTAKVRRTTATTAPASARPAKATPSTTTATPSTLATQTPPTAVRPTGLNPDGR